MGSYGFKAPVEAGVFMSTVSRNPRKFSRLPTSLPRAWAPLALILGKFEMGGWEDRCRLRYATKLTNAHKLKSAAAPSIPLFAS